MAEFRHIIEGCIAVMNMKMDIMGFEMSFMNIMMFMVFMFFALYVIFGATK